MKRVIAFVLMWAVCAITDVVALLLMLLSSIFGSGRRAMRIAVAKDQVGNAAAAGSEDETFSARCWRLRGSPTYHRFVVVIDYVFYLLADQKAHCKGAFESEKARRARPYSEEN